MSAKAGVFDPEGYDRTARNTVPGYAALQEMVALAASGGVAPTSRVLDVGPGTGVGLLALARVLPAATFVGCDPALPMITAAHQRCALAGFEVRAVHGGVEALGEDEPPFDVIVCTLVMHFIPIEQRARWLRALRARLAPRGRFLLTALTRAEDAETNATWASLRRDYAARNGVSPEQLARRQAESAAQVDPVRESDLHAQLGEAGFGAATPLFQILAARGWLVRHLGDSDHD